MLVRRLTLALASLLMAAFSWPAAAAPASTLCVNQGGTGGCFGLIADAIAAAGAGDTIRIASAPNPYFERLTITKSLSLIGDDPATTIIDGALAGQVIWISPTLTVTLAYLTIHNGQAGFGANSTNYGGGIHSEATSLTLNNVIVSGNHTGRTSLFGNPGGGIYTREGTLTLNHSTVSGNTTATPNISGTLGGNGGGIYNAGAGLYVVQEPVTLTTSTISGNATGRGLFSSAGGDGGGLYILQANPVNLTNVTVAFNAVDVLSAGGAIANNGGVVNVKNSLLVKNHDANGPDNVRDCSGALNSLGYNVMTEPDCTPPIVSTTGDQFYVSGLIVLPLANNGGPTPTNALPPGSLAIDAANNSACSPTDQRGFARPVFGGAALRCDVGAFELYRFGVNLPAILR